MSVAGNDLLGPRQNRLSLKHSSRHGKNCRKEGSASRRSVGADTLTLFSAFQHDPPIRRDGRSITRLVRPPRLTLAKVQTRPGNVNELTRRVVL